MVKNGFYFSFTMVLGIPNHIAAFSCLKNWTRRTFYNQIDLVTQSCYSEIIPGLYLSNARAAADRNILRHLQITHVLTVETRRLPKSTFVDSDISTLYIRATDTPGTNLISYFPISNSFIDEGLREGNVIVHCHFGVSRSATLVIAYIMNKYKLPYQKAYNIVRNRRKFINPNPGFVRQLKEYERNNYNVSGLQKLEAFMSVNARKYKVKIASIAAVMFGIVVPLAFLMI